MNKSSTTQVGRRMDMLPLEKWIAEERSRSGTMRPLGEVVADVVRKAGRPHEGGGREIDPTGSQGGGMTTRSETGGKKAMAEAMAVALAGTVRSQGKAVDFLPNTMLDRPMHTNGAVAVVVVCIGMASGEHG